MKQLPVYIINLEKDIQKKKYMVNLCDKYGLKYSFINAVDGSRLDDKEINQIVDHKLSLKKLKRKLVKAEIGCLLSHLSIYKKMISDNIEVSLILEDDVNFDHSLIDFFQCYEKLPLKYDLLLLGHHKALSRDKPGSSNFWSKKIKIDKFEISRPTEVCYGTYGYLITYEGAIKLKDRINKFYLPIDNYTGSDKFSNLYIMQKPIILVNEDFTSKYTSMTERNNMKLSFFNRILNFISKKDIYKKLVILKYNFFLFWGRFKILKKYK